MRDANLFTMLTSYHPGSTATPFETYCTNALAYLLNRGQNMLRALFAHAGGVGNEPLADVEVQPRLADAGIADLLLTFEGGRRIVVEVQVETAADESLLPGFVSVASQWDMNASFVVLGLHREAAPPWQAVSWLAVVEALDDDPDPLAQQFRDFVLADILGMGPVPLDEALSTNKLYALGGGAIRRRFGNEARYANAASRPMAGRYRYIGTMFSGGPAEEMEYWLGIVNETVPLGEHYQLMLAAKQRRLKEPSVQPRALGDWKWQGWTGIGRVVRPITIEAYDRLLSRL